jgi:hypothetical protein
MQEDRLDRIERILDRVAKEQELFALEMRQLQDAQAETDKYIKNLGKTVGELTGGWGRFVEGMMEPSVIKWVKEDLKLVIQKITRNMELYEDGNVVGEIDLLIDGESDGERVIVVVEAKSSFESTDMRRFKELLNKFFAYLPECKDAGVVGVIAATRFGNGVKKDALRWGLYVFEPEDSIMKVTAPTKPKVLKYKEDARR